MRKIQNTLPVHYAALMGRCLPTAFALSRMFDKLTPGDIVVQNNACDAIGMLLVQLATLRNICTINITADRPELEDRKMRELIKMMGGTVAVTSEFVEVGDYARRLVGSDGKVVLGFNGADGKDALAVAALLNEGVTMVTYGSGTQVQPMKSLSLETFNLDKCLSNMSPENASEFFAELSEMVRDGSLKVPMEEHEFGGDFEDAISSAQQSRDLALGRKVFFSMRS